jgi:hypothetical protein
LIYVRKLLPMPLSTYLTICTGVISLNFGWWLYLQKSARAELIHNASQWLCGTYDETGITTWRSHLTTSFDKIFGIEPFSKSFLLQSFKVTAVTAVVVYMSGLFIWWLIDADSLKKVILSDDFKIQYAFGVVLGSFIYNAIPDFLSLLETRLVMSYVHNLTDRRKILAYLLVDLFLSTGIFVVWFSLVTTALAFSHEWAKEHGLFEYVFIGYLSGVVLGFVSNYLSSGWIWIYGAAGPVHRLINHIFRGRLTAFSKNYLDIEEKPFNYLAALTSIILVIPLALCYVVLLRWFQ